MKWATMGLYNWALNSVRAANLYAPFKRESWRPREKGGKEAAPSDAGSENDGP